MKIGIICPYDIFRGGGVQEHVLAQAAELRRRGHTVKIITPKPRTYQKDEEPKDIIFIGASTNVKTPISTNLELGVSFYRAAIDEMLKREAFDVLHIHEPEVPIIAAQILVRASCPLVMTFHAMYPENSVGKTLETVRSPKARSILARAAAITAVSEPAARFIREQTEMPVQIIPNGIDLQKYHADRPENSSSDKKILYIGRLEKRKGVRYLLDAFERLVQRMPQASLTIAGDGPERVRLENYVVNHDIPNVRFLGYVDEPEKLEQLRRAAVFCSPALYGESFGIVLLEAMAMQVPIVAGDNPGYVGLMQDRGALSICNPKDTADFARKLEAFLCDEELRTLWLRWAAEYVKRFDYTLVVDRYEAIYRKVAPGNHHE